MSFKSFLSEKLKQVSIIPTVNLAKSVSNLTDNKLDDKIVDKVTEYTNPVAIAKGGNSLAKAIANGFATFGASTGDVIGRAGIYATGKATGNEELAKKATEMKTGSYELPGSIGKWVGPITPYPDQYMNRRDEGQSPTEAGLKTVGTAALDNPFGTEIKAVGIAGSLAFKGGKEALEPVLKKIAQSKSAANIAKWLGGILKGGENAQIDTLAKQLVSADTPELVTKTLDDAIVGKERTVFRTSKTPFDKKLMQEDGVFTSPDKTFAEKWGKNLGYGPVEELKIASDAKILHIDDFPKKFIKEEDGYKYYSLDDQAEIIKYAKQNGYDGFESISLVPGGSKIEPEIAFWNKDKIRVVPSKLDDMADPALKQSKFAERVAESDKVDPLVASDLDKVVYSVAKNKDTVKLADDYLAKTSTDDALKRFNDAYKVDEAGKVVEDNLTPELNVIGIKLIDQLQAAGRHDEIFNIVEKMSQSATTKGQAIQALSLFSRVSPEGVVNFAANKLSKAGMKADDIKKAMTPEFIDEITAMSKANQKIEAGSYQRAVADSLLLKKIGDLVPSSLGSKLSTAQTLSLLLNPKTITRNIIGNAGFNAAEGVAHNVFSTPLDALTSLFTGKRTKVFSSPETFGKGFMTGLKEGTSEAWQKIDTKQLSTSYDFKSGVFKTGIMDKLERGLGVALKGPDRAFYQATYDSSLADGIQAYAKTKKIVAEGMDDLLSKIPEKELDRLKEVAHYDGLYRTFQDPSRLADSLQMVKTALNKIGTADGKFGLGDAIIKFPRTPANLINRGLAYSPAGFLKTVVEAAKPLIGKPFNQKAFVESFGRAMTGTSGLMGTGFMLNQLGIIEGAAPESQALGQTQRTTGLGAYKINASALKRFVLSGFNPDVTEKQKGDVLYSYDWFQPLAMGVSMGANMSESSKDGNLEDSVYNVLGMIQSGVNTTGEQPLFKNITDLFSGYGKPSDKIMKVLSGVPQTFIPTLVKQVRDLVDENQRETYDPSLFNQTVNTIKNKIPFASETLPSKVDTFGQDQKTYQDGTNNVFNVMLNPGFITEYKPTDEAKMVIQLFKETGSESALPNVLNKNIQVNGESHKLTSDEYYNMKKLTGILTQRALYKMSQDPNFTGMTPADQAKAIGNTLTDIGAASKILLLGSKPKTIDGGTQKVLNYYMQNKEDLKKTLIPPTVNK